MHGQFPVQDPSAFVLGTPQTRRDREQLKQRIRSVPGDLFNHKKITTQGITCPELMTKIVEFAKANQLPLPDRNAKRHHDGLLCWLCIHDPNDRIRRLPQIIHPISQLPPQPFVLSSDADAGDRFWFEDDQSSRTIHSKHSFHHSLVEVRLFQRLHNKTKVFKPILGLISIIVAILNFLIRLFGCLHGRVNLAYQIHFQ
jgi:hypothetical protein